MMTGVADAAVRSRGARTPKRIAPSGARDAPKPTSPSAAMRSTSRARLL